MSLDHGKVTISLLSKDLKKSKSLSFSVIGGTDNFVKQYDLVKSNSNHAIRMGRTELTVVVEGDYENQTEYYVSNNPELIEAVRNDDHSNLKTFYS